MSRQLDNGAMVSSPLEDVEPFLDREDLAKNMSHIIGGSSLVNFDPHNRTCNNALNQGLQEVSPSQSTDDKIVISRSSGIYEDIYRSGVCIWFTGLSGSGKTTTAIHLVDCFRKTGRRVTLLDGDVVRDNLSRGLGFSKQDRDVNILRIGYVASEIVRHGGICICAAISPYILTRREVRDLVGKDHFVEVFVDTPVEICEKRDTKGLYKKARLGELKGFTGIDDPYEPPLDPELKLDTTAITVEENCRQIMEHIMRRNLAGF
jgi:adenylyl-sulfate kinase